MKKKFCVTIVRTGCLFVEAESAEAAMELADHQTTDTVSWSEDWGPTDAFEDGTYCGEYITERAFD